MIRHFHSRHPFGVFQPLFAQKAQPYSGEHHKALSPAGLDLKGEGRWQRQLSNQETLALMS